MSALHSWMKERHALIAELGALLHSGLQAAGRFDARAFFDVTERQQEVARQIQELDRRMPAAECDMAERRRLAAELKVMNQELEQMGKVLAALIERGSKSASCFQRVWALGSAAYRPPSGA